jgi:holo-[acyl-carrier protein] synthase
MDECILGIGVDMEPVDGFEKFAYDNRNAFLRRVYTENERAYCFSKKRCAEHLAVRFAAKEAVMKALSGTAGRAVDYRDIEVIRGSRGAPSIRLPAALRKKAAVRISLSHTSDMAIAFAVAVTP